MSSFRGGGGGSGFRELSGRCNSAKGRYSGRVIPRLFEPEYALAFFSRFYSVTCRAESHERVHYVYYAPTRKWA